MDLTKRKIIGEVTFNVLHMFAVHTTDFSAFAQVKCQRVSQRNFLFLSLALLVCLLVQFWRPLQAAASSTSSFASTNNKIRCQCSSILISPSPISSHLNLISYLTSRILSDHYIITNFIFIYIYTYIC